ncbi:MAG: ABC transporter permease [Halanaerobiaceae bacterium]|jgi:putative ABC transport system permease protein|nr:ABC transporter permease [Halanaerobiaceae bacterium]
MNIYTLQSALELGIIYSLLALGSFISYRTLNFPDLTVEGSYTLGAAVSVMVTLAGYPYLSLLAAFVAGAVAGSITALLSTRLKIQPLLAGILLMLGLYSINLKVMGNRANVNLINHRNIYSIFEGTIVEGFQTLITASLVLAVVLIILYFFLKTRLGFVLRATGDNHVMVRALGTNTDFTILLGLSLSNGLVALCGAMIAHEQLFADIGMGIGMVVIGLASVIIGEVLFGTNTLLRRMIAVILGAIVYRLIITIVLEFGMPATDLKLISAIIVAVALSMPVIKEKMELAGRKKANLRGGRSNAGN